MQKIVICTVYASWTLKIAEDVSDVSDNELWDLVRGSSPDVLVIDREPEKKEDEKD